MPTEAEIDAMILEVRAALGKIDSKRVEDVRRAMADDTQTP
jgi:hypothetical protein